MSDLCIEVTKHLQSVKITKSIITRILFLPSVRRTQFHHIWQHIEIPQQVVPDVFFPSFVLAIFPSHEVKNQLLTLLELLHVDQPAVAVPQVLVHSLHHFFFDSLCFQTVVVFDPEHLEVVVQLGRPHIRFLHYSKYKL